MMILHIPTSDDPKSAAVAEKFLHVEDGMNPAELRSKISEESMVFPLMELANGSLEPIQTSPVIIMNPYIRVEGMLPASEETKGFTLFMMLVTQIDNVDKANTEQVKNMLAEIMQRVQEEQALGHLTFGFALNAGEVFLPPIALLLKEYKAALQQFDYVLTPAKNRIEAMLTQIVGRAGTGINIHTNRDAKSVWDMVNFTLQVTKEIKMGKRGTA